MEFANRYLNKNKFLDIDITRAPSGLLRYIVAIPAFSETQITTTLESLLSCCPPRNGTIEVLILINFSEAISQDIKQQNNDIYNLITRWSIENNSSWITFHSIIARNLPAKHAGAGLARKIVMDAAISRFGKINSPEGLIFSLDADTTVPPNYFTAVEDKLTEKPKTGCIIFNFNHPTTGNEFSKKVYGAAILYEIHLRYYKQTLKSTGFPYYHYTIGSCFAIKAEIYTKLGGLNRRKAGEDFYFLHKVFPNTSTAFLPNVIVTPSPRPSWRVPFGTGPTIRKILSAISPTYFTYHPELFYELAVFFKQSSCFYNASSIELKSFMFDFPENIVLFLEEIEWIIKIKEINDNCSTKEAFVKRFFLWFDSFRILKFLNFASDKTQPNINVLDAAKSLLNIPLKKEISAIEILNELKQLD